MELRNRLAFYWCPRFVTFLVAALMACGGTSGRQASGSIQPLYPYDPTAVTVTGAENFYADLLHQIGGGHLQDDYLLHCPPPGPDPLRRTVAVARERGDAPLPVE